MKTNGTMHEFGLTLFSQKSEHIVTTHYSMSGTNKLVESPPHFMSLTCPMEKRNPMVGPFFSPLIVCLQINLPNVKLVGCRLV
jgi:hypothetical protein